MLSDLMFDFFGTLVHYTAGSFHTAPYERTHAFLHEHGFAIDYATFEHRYTTIALTFEAQAKETMREYHMDDVARAFFLAAFTAHVPISLIQGFVRCFIAEWSRGIRPIDGIQVFLAALAADYRLTVVSNTHYPALIHDHLANMDIAQYFAQVVTSVEFGWRKPHPSIFRHALANLGIPANASLYIGDTFIDDYQGAQAAGIRAMLIDPYNQYPAVVDRMPGLFDLKPLLHSDGWKSRG